MAVYNCTERGQWPVLRSTTSLLVLQHKPTTVGLTKGPSCRDACAYGFWVTWDIVLPIS